MDKDKDKDKEKDKDVGDSTESNGASQINYKTPQKSSTMIDCEKLLDKINQLTTKPENVSYTTKVNE